MEILLVSVAIVLLADYLHYRRLQRKIERFQRESDARVKALEELYRKHSPPGS